MKTSSKIAITIIVLIFVVLGIFAFSNLTGNSIKDSDATIKIGAIMPLTGDVANMASDTKIAIKIATDEINAAGGINGKKLEVIYEDGRCDPKEAVNAGNKLINIDKVQAIIGGWCSGETLAIAPIAESNKVVLFSPGSSSPKITNAGDYIFRDYPSDAYQGKVAAEYTYNNLGKRKVAVLYWQGDWAVGIKPVFENRFKELGGEIISEESFEIGVKDLRTQLTKIKQANPDVIYFLSMPAEAIIGLKQAKEMNMNIQFVGGDAWDDAKIPSEAGSAADNSIYFVPYAPLTQDFKAKMKKEKNGDEGIVMASPNAYDAVHIIANIIKKVGNDGEKIKDELYKVKDYQGVSGVINFDSNGDLVSGKYVTKQMKDGKSVVISGG